MVEGTYRTVLGSEGDYQNRKRRYNSRSVQRSVAALTGNVSKKGVANGCVAASNALRVRMRRLSVHTREPGGKFKLGSSVSSVSMERKTVTQRSYQEHSQNNTMENEKVRA